MTLTTDAPSSAHLTRRSLLKAAPVAAFAVTIPTAALGAGPDAKIEQAWAARVAAYNAYNALPQDGDNDAAEERFWQIIEDAEEVIRSSVARTPRGAAIQLWASVHHEVTSQVDEADVLAGNFDALDTDERGLDWNIRLALSALRSLAAMGGQVS